MKETKLKVVLPALAGGKPISQITQEHSVHPSLIKEWKVQALDAMGERFGKIQSAHQHGRARQLPRQLAIVQVVDFDKHHSYKTTKRKSNNCS